MGDADWLLFSRDFTVRMTVGPWWKQKAMEEGVERRLLPLAKKIPRLLHLCLFECEKISGLCRGWSIAVPNCCSVPLITFLPVNNTVRAVETFSLTKTCHKTFISWSMRSTSRGALSEIRQGATFGIKKFLPAAMLFHVSKCERTLELIILYQNSEEVGLM